MAKKQGIDDISKAIMKAIEAARAAATKAKPASTDVSDVMTKKHKKVIKKIIKEEDKNWMMPDGVLMPKKKAKKALKKYGTKW